MPNNTYVDIVKFGEELTESMIQGSLTSPFITSSVKWTGAKTFKFLGMNVSGFKNHNTAGGWNRGSVTMFDNEYTITHDRDIEYFVDKRDVLQNNGTLTVQNILRKHVQENSVPEMDAVFFENVSKAAIKANLKSETAIGDYTAENVYSKLKAMLKNGRLRAYRTSKSLIMYVNSDIMDLLEAAKDFTRKIEVTQIAEGGAGIETRVTSIDGIPVMEVYDVERFYTAFDYTENFVPTGKKLNVCIVSLDTVKTVPLIDDVAILNPEQCRHLGSGYAGQLRQMYDTFVFPNNKGNKVDSVFVDYQPAG